jgi:O-antigen/teichoic acid export membrane protein
MTLFVRNIIANFANQTVSVLWGVVLVPIYLRTLGVEAYGLIGFFTSLQLLAGLFDLGLCGTLNREIARRAAFPHHSQGSRHLVFTFQFVYSSIGCVLGLALMVGSGWITEHWLKVQDLPENLVRGSVIVYGATLALRWPIGLYESVLRGLERQVLLNTWSVAIATVRNTGAVILLTLISPSLLVFLVWQTVAGALETVVLARAAWKALHGRERPSYLVWRQLAKLWSFAAWLSGATIFAVLLNQVDKIAVSKFLPLERMGFYTVASTLNSVVAFAVAPVFYAIYPRLSALQAAEAVEEMGHVYHDGSQFVSAVVAPLASFLYFFSYDVIFLWTRSHLVAEAAHRVLSLMVLGTAMNSIMGYVPTALQLACGLGWIPFVGYGAGVILMIPILWWGVHLWDIEGAALAWALCNMFFYVSLPALTHQFALKGHARQWYFRDTLIYILVSIAVTAVVYRLRREAGDMAVMAATLLFSYGVSFAICRPLRNYLGRLILWKGRENRQE